MEFLASLIFHRLPRYNYIIQKQKTSKKTYKKKIDSILFGVKFECENYVWRDLKNSDNHLVCAAAVGLNFPLKQRVVRKIVTRQR